MWLIGFVVVLIIWLGFCIEESIMHYLTGVSILDQMKKWLRIQSPSGRMSNEHNAVKRVD